MDWQMDTRPSQWGGDGSSELVETLQRRVIELEDFMQRVEADAANTVALAEELAVAKDMADCALRRAENSEIRTKSILDTVVDGIIAVDSRGVVESLNASALRMLTVCEAEIVGRRLTSVLYDIEGDHDLQSIFSSADHELLQDGQCVTLQCRVGPNASPQFPAELTMTKASISGETKFTCVLRDITERKNAERAIEKLALYDQLTGAANRHEFQRRLGNAIKLAARRNMNAALLLLDLDKFKEVNDTFGHPVGDALLVSVTKVLKECVRESDTVARIGGDEFAIILNDVADPLRVRKVAERVVEGVGQPIVIDGSLVSTGISVGICVFPRDANESRELIRLCDKALYEAKRRGRGNYQYYDEVMDSNARDARVLENDLRLALVRDELEIHYQPQLDLQTDALMGAEALVRWRHPTRGLLFPGDFIPLAESTGLIVDLGNHVLSAACEEARLQADAGIEPFPVAVNVSPYQFMRDEFVDTVSEALTRSGIAPNRLELEITENVLINDPETVSEKLATIHDLGVSVAIDDFGTGYSSLSYLRNFPVQKLKIAQEFVQNLSDSAPDSVIAEAIVRLAQSLNMCTVAEGVETERQVEAMRAFLCNGMQGFFFSKPLSTHDFRRWLVLR